MAVFNDGTTDTSYEYVDILIGLFCIFLTTSSTFFNGVLFSYNIRLKTTQSRLYTLLAVFNFLTLLFYPVAMAINFLSTSPQLSVPEGLMLGLQAATMFFTCFSSLLVSLICIYRLLGIKFPFIRVSATKLLVALGFITVYSLLETSITVVISNPEHPFWYQQRQMFDFHGWKCTNDIPENKEIIESFKSLHRYYIIPKATYLITMIINTITSIMAVYVLVTTKSTSEQSSQKMRKSAVTMFILNLVSVFAGLYIIIISMVFLEGSQYSCYSTIGQKVLILFSFPLSPIMVALFNPLTIISRSTEMMMYIKVKLGLMNGVIHEHAATVRRTVVRYKHRPSCNETQM